MSHPCHRRSGSVIHQDVARIAVVAQAPEHRTVTYRAGASCAITELRGIRPIGRTRDGHGSVRWRLTESVVRISCGK
jgi:hypothetical protein